MKKQNKTIKTFITILTVIAFIAVSAIGAYLSIQHTIKQEFGAPSENLSLMQKVVFPIELYFYKESLMKSLHEISNEQDFSIEQGESVGMISLRLEKAGLVPNAELLRTYLVYTGLDRQLKSGQFVLNTSMSPVEIVSELLDASQRNVIVTILPGWRIEEIAANVAASGLGVTADEFINAAVSPSAELLSILAIDDLTTLEGFLFPGIYTLPRESNLETLMTMILKYFNHNIDETIRLGFERQGFTIVEAVILASIVEKEAIVSDEKPLIASVFFNRLENNMRLETDPTVQFALGFDRETQSWWKSPLSLADLSTPSEFNTYLNYGLPPGPICSPDLDSMRAVAFPAETPYFYFRAACDDSGRHNFATTFDEHLNNRCK